MAKKNVDLKEEIMRILPAAPVGSTGTFLLEDLRDTLGRAGVKFGEKELLENLSHLINSGLFGVHTFVQSHTHWLTGAWYELRICAVFEN